MPDTDDEGSVADNASDAGGARLDAITRGADEEAKVKTECIYVYERRRSPLPPPPLDAPPLDKDDWIRTLYSCSSCCCERGF